MSRYRIQTIDGVPHLDGLPVADGTELETKCADGEWRLCRYHSGPDQPTRIMMPPGVLIPPERWRPFRWPATGAA